jgi:hypothetical protein
MYEMRIFGRVGNPLPSPPTIRVRRYPRLSRHHYYSYRRSYSPYHYREFANSRERHQYYGDEWWRMVKKNWWDEWRVKFIYEKWRCLLTVYFFDFVLKIHLKIRFIYLFIFTIISINVFTYLIFIFVLLLLLPRPLFWDILSIWRAQWNKPTANQRGNRTLATLLGRTCSTFLCQRAHRPNDRTHCDGELEGDYIERTIGRENNFMGSMWGVGIGNEKRVQSFFSLCFLYILFKMPSISSFFFN